MQSSPGTLGATVDGNVLGSHVADGANQSFTALSGPDENDSRHRFVPDLRVTTLSLVKQHHSKYETAATLSLDPPNRRGEIKCWQWKSGCEHGLRGVHVRRGIVAIN
jgi:hypothetical protein